MAAGSVLDAEGAGVEALEHPLSTSALAPMMANAPRAVMVLFLKDTGAFLSVGIRLSVSRWGSRCVQLCFGFSCR
jgi:hypothetical protein